MKIKKIALVTLLGAALFAVTANADIQVSTSAKALTAEADACDQFVGSWAGDANISASVLWSKISCHYSGDAGAVTVAKTGGNTYSVTINVNAVGGSSSVCPGHYESTPPLPATCSGGKIKIATGGANLDGQLSSDARTADLHGTIKIPVPVVGSIDANVDSMHLSKR